MGDADDTERANRFQSYIKGWRDGASLTAMRKEFQGHRLEPYYAAGYSDGRDARARASALRALTALAGGPDAVSAGIALAAGRMQDPARIARTTRTAP